MAARKKSTESMAAAGDSPEAVAAPAAAGTGDSSMPGEQTGDLTAEAGDGTTADADAPADAPPADASTEPAPAAPDSPDPAGTEPPAPTSPDPDPVPVVEAEICTECFPRGWPDTATAGGCAHGNYERTLPTT
ncbi:hypothetical protein ACFRDV_21985 [Streptomyces fagopyri]|uniref:hypothetical protein n=1 Tax=Streptomyces fagopyri TaxID=2662397 RepID=UPI0036BC99A7